MTRPSKDTRERMTVDELAADVERFIRSHARVSPDDTRFARNSNLWQDGYLDSIGIVELIGFIEDTCGVLLPDEALFDPDFTSVDGIARIVSGLVQDRTT